MPDAHLLFDKVELRATSLNCALFPMLQILPTMVDISNISVRHPLTRKIRAIPNGANMILKIMELAQAPHQPALNHRPAMPYLWPATRSLKPPFRWSR